MISRKTSAKMDSKLIWEKVEVLEVNFYVVSINLTKLTLLKKNITASPWTHFSIQPTSMVKNWFIQKAYIEHLLFNKYDSQNPGYIRKQTPLP